MFAGDRISCFCRNSWDLTAVTADNGRPKVVNLRNKGSRVKEHELAGRNVPSGKDLSTDLSIPCLGSVTVHIDVLAVQNALGLSPCGILC